MIKKIKRKLYNFLIWTQKWAKTDMVYLAKSSFWLTIGKSISILAGLLSSIVFANLLSKETFGIYQYVLSIIPILSIPTLNGINTAIIRAVARGYEGSYLDALKTKIKWGALGGIASLLLSGYYFLNHDITLGVCFLIVSFFIPIMDPLSIYVSFLNGKKDFKTISKYSIIITRIGILIVLISTLLLTKNVFFILFSFLISTTFFRLLFFFVTFKKHKPNNKKDSEVIGFGKHLSLMKIMGVIAKHIDKILIFHYLGAVELAIYSFALMPLRKVQTPLSNFGRIVLPKLSQKNIGELKKSMPNKIKKMFLILIPLIIIYITIIPFFFKLLLPQYTNSIIYSQLFSLTLIFFPKNLISQIFTAHLFKKELYITNLLFPTIKIILFLILLPKYKIFGIISALIIVEIISMIVLMILFKKIKVQKNEG